MAEKQIALRGDLKLVTAEFLEQLTIVEKWITP